MSRIRITAANHVFVAETSPGAPKTVAAFMGLLAGNHFMSVGGNRQDLRKLGTEVLWGGAKDILFERID